ncbi:MAG: hypothetical protein HYV07_02735 [Deltaproteobacteria bacterium]|nr:hypothetical protein [Deltaproteobacteria bacterium]
MARINGNGGYSPPPPVQAERPQAPPGVRSANSGEGLEVLVDDCVRFRKEAAEFLKSVLPNVRFETVDGFGRGADPSLFSGSSVTGSERRTRPVGSRTSEAPDKPADKPSSETADPTQPQRGSAEWKAMREAKLKAVAEKKGLDPWVVAGRRAEMDMKRTLERADEYNERVGDVIEDHIFDGLQRFNESRASTNWERDQFRKTEYRLEDEAHYDKKLDEAADTRRSETESDARREYEMRRMEADIERRAADRRNRER